MKSNEKQFIYDDIVRYLKYNEDWNRWTKLYRSDAITYAESEEIVAKVVDNYLDRMTNTTEEMFLYAREKLLDFSEAVADATQTNILVRNQINLGVVKDRDKISELKSVTKQLSDSLKENGGKLETVPKSAKREVVNKALKIIDNTQSGNGKFLRDNGYPVYVKRVWDGETGSHDTKHTDYCNKLEGKWEYGKEPKEIWQRHEGCECLIIIDVEKPKTKLQGIKERELNRVRKAKGLVDLP